MNEITPYTFKSLDLANLISNTSCVVIKFEGSWCAPCKSKIFKENYNKLKSKYASQSNIIKFIELDIDEYEDLIQSKEYYDIEVTNIPFFKLTYNGNWAKDFSGCACIGDIDTVLYNITKKYNHDESQKLEKLEKF
jgi:thiol-disulfide isomerase/thioredoxin